MLCPDEGTSTKAGTSYWMRAEMDQSVFGDPSPDPIVLGVLNYQKRDEIKKYLEPGMLVLNPPRCALCASVKKSEGQSHAFMYMKARWSITVPACMYMNFVPSGACITVPAAPCMYMQASECMFVPSCT